MEDPLAVLRPCHQSQALLVSSAQANWQEVESPPNISIAFEGKPHSSLKAIAQAFNRQFTACSAQQNQALKRLMRDLHNHHRADLSNRPFYERGVAAAIRKAGSSTAQEPDGLTVLHLRHLGEHGLAFLTELLHPGHWEELRHNPDFEGKEVTKPSSLLPLHLTPLPGSENIGAAPPPIHRGGNGYTLLPARFQTEALHRLGLLPISARVVSGFNSHGGGHLEGVRHSLSPPLYRDGPPPSTPSQFGEVA